MTRIPKEHAVGPVPVTKAGKPVGCRAPDKALLGAIISLVHAYGLITSFDHNADQILHIRFEDGARVGIAARLRDAPAVREFLVRAMHHIN